MARMIPDAPVPETESKAERHLFERLRDDTPDELVAYHSVAWQTPGRWSPGAGRVRLRRRASRVRRAHTRSQGEAVFASTLSRGSGRRSASPVRSRSKTPSSRQTERRTCSPRRLLGRSDRAARRSASVTVAFPDCRVGRKPLRTDLPRELVLDHSDLDCLDTRLDALFQYWFDRDSKTPLGEPGLKVLDSVLAHSFDLRGAARFRAQG